MDDMMETMVAAPGVGLAAPQVDVSIRVITIRVDNQLLHLANPEIIKADGEQIGYEGCLSIPGMVDGILFTDRLTDPSTLRRVEEMGDEEIANIEGEAVTV
jgi:peptide deformylase